jgi:hypothetical protein
VLEYAWFRLLVRGIGVLLIGLGVPAIVSVVINLINYFLSNESLTRGSFWLSPMFVSAAYGAASLAQSLVGVYLLFGANRLIAFCMRDVLDHCTACGYDLRRVGAPNCPECGVPIHARPGRTPPVILPPS